MLQCLLLFFTQLLQLEVIVTDLLTQLIGSFLHFFDPLSQIPWAVQGHEKQMESESKLSKTQALLLRKNTKDFDLINPNLSQKIVL